MVAQAEGPIERTVRVTDLELSREAGVRDIAFRIVGSKGVRVQALMQDLVRLPGLSCMWLSIPDFFPCACRIVCSKGVCMRALMQDLCVLRIL